MTTRFGAATLLAALASIAVAPSAMQRGNDEQRDLAGTWSFSTLTALERLSGRVSAADMRAMNYAADVEHRDVAAIARQFLASLR